MQRKIIETIILNKRVRAKHRWSTWATGTEIDLRNPTTNHAWSFEAPRMLRHLMEKGRIRLYPYNSTTVALQIYEDSNPYLLQITKNIIKEEIARMERLDALERSSPSKDER